MTVIRTDHFWAEIRTRGLLNMKHKCYQLHAALRQTHYKLLYLRDKLVARPVSREIVANQDQTSLAGCMEAVS